MVVGLMRQEVASRHGVDATLTGFVADLRAVLGSIRELRIEAAESQKMNRWKPRQTSPTTPYCTCESLGKKTKQKDWSERDEQDQNVKEMTKLGAKSRSRVLEVRTTTLKYKKQERI